jgi:cyclopropane fatty-acyl-phospholipid synthase-like methyltransferase
VGQKVTSEYWERIWVDSDLPRAVEPERDTLRNHSYHEFHRLFAKYVSRQDGKRIIEFGCAQSIWLTYFARRHAIAVSGIDYSPLGCAKASAILARSRVEGKIVLADFMRPPDNLLGAFDFGVSFGVAEHFDDTAECISAFRRFLKPGGLLFTMIPNLAGLTGSLQKFVDRKIYDIHVPLDDAALAAAHRQAGMQVVESRYVVCSNFGVLTISDQAGAAAQLKRLFRLALMGISAVTWVINRYIVTIPPSRYLSPYIVCVARAP